MPADISDMGSTLHDQSTPLDQRIEAAIKQCERELQISITLHDLYGRLRKDDGKPFLRGRNMHQHPLCQLARQDSLQGCLQHCKERAHAEATHRRQPFAMTCWKGIRELVIPLLEHDTVTVLMFAGCWRTTTSQPATNVPRLKQSQAMHAHLPLWNTRRMKTLAQHLTLWGSGLLQKLNPIDTSQKQNRKSIILNFISTNAHHAIALADIADLLNCSISRAGHAVVEACGTTFTELVAQERLQRAQALLTDSLLSLEDIALNCGYSDHYYFNRVFTRRMGSPPGRWRKAQQAP